MNMLLFMVVAKHAGSGSTVSCWLTVQRLECRLKHDIVITCNVTILIVHTSTQKLPVVYTHRLDHSCESSLEVTPLVPLFTNGSPFCL